MTGIIEKWREEFEVYCDSLDHKIPVVKNSDGKYTFLSTRGLFDCWLASRLSVVIETLSPSHLSVDRENDWDDLRYKKIANENFEQGAQAMIDSISYQGYRVEIKK